MHVTILGNNSALPAFGRHPTAQLLSLDGVDILIDCGEGTQMQFQQFSIRWRKLRHILISHLHGDHYFGLPGLINSMSLNGRTLPLDVYAPAPLEAILQQIFDAANTQLTFDLIFHPLPDCGRRALHQCAAYEISCFPVDHRISCHGFIIKELTPRRKLNPDACQQNNIPVNYYKQIVEGEDYHTEDGRVIPNHLLTIPAPPPRRYAYTADTRIASDYLPDIEGANLLYHESTYLDIDKDKAQSRYHSTALEAATVAQKAKVGKLILGHFSSRYKLLDPFLEEAKTVFPNTELAEEGKTYEVN